MIHATDETTPRRQAEEKHEELCQAQSQKRSERKTSTRLDDGKNGKRKGKAAIFFEKDH